MTRPDNVVVILLDSMNRHHLGTYGSAEFDTPNLDRLAARSVTFDRHYAGSLPCIPARHDILCGALDFLWRPWGSIEIWEDAITHHLRRAGVTTMLVSDHPHLFETGGENYHCDFTAWDYVRGHEDDPWRTVADPTWAGAPALPAVRSPIARHYDQSRTWFRSEEDYPGPRTMTAAAEWLDAQAPSDKRFFLFIDEFDPHEPFDVPEPWASRYDEGWEGPHLIWPPYVEGAIAKGILDERSARQLRSNYGAKLSMIDHWLGRVLDVFDRRQLWDDTALVVCSDHGHYLGEKDIFGKPGVPIYEPMGHIPLLVAWPGRPARRVDALTTSVDLFATLCDVFGVTADHRTHGNSLVPLIEGSTDSVRDWALSGIWGREVHLINGRHKYVRAAPAENLPLSMWSNRWSTMPIHAWPELRLPRPDRRATLQTMPGSEVPVIRQPFTAGDELPFWARLGAFDGHHVYDLGVDPMEEENRVGEPIEAALVEQLTEALRSVDAPSDHFERLGLRT
jgi:arylsulfatase A-like enzyme